MPFYGGHPLLYYNRIEQICFHNNPARSGYLIQDMAD